MRVVRELPATHTFHVRDGVYELDTSRHTRGWSSGADGWEEECSGIDLETGLPVHRLATNLCLAYENNFSFLRNAWLKPLGYDDYSTGGYGKLISTSNRSDFSRALNLLESANLIDDDVVAVALSLNVLNARSNLLSVVRVLFEFSRTGNVMNSVLIASVRGHVFDLDEPADVARMCLAALFYAMVVFYTLVLVREWARSGVTWLLDFFNICEVAISASTLGFLGCYLRFLHRHDHIVNENRWRTDDIAGVAITYHILLTTMAWTLLLCIVK